MLGPHNQQPPPLTPEDWKKIEKSMKKPQFMGLLSEYMVEISDPKNKKEYDDYLLQMEADGELPKHMKLIKPTPQFCVKTALIAHSNKSQQMKFFINICSATQIQKPSFETVASDSGVGQNWKLPNSMGKIRYDQDKKGNICNTVDSIFNPQVFHFCRNERFQAMVINIAIQTAQKQLGQRKQTISKDYKILQNFNCKGQPALLPVRSIQGKLYNKGQGGQIERDRDGKQTKLQKQINDKKKQFEQIKQKQQNQKKQQVTDDDLSETIVQQDHKGPQRPLFNTIYSYPVEYMDFLEAGAKPRKIPNALNIQFKIPLILQFKQIKSLDINETKILLDAGQKYFIDLSIEQLKIKYQLVFSQSKAKFDKKKKTLRITIPIDKNSILKQQTQNPEPQGNNKQQQQNNLLLQQAIQEKTWQDKNKLLQITSENVAISTISNENAQQKPIKKFVQQIDEDDIENSQPIYVAQTQQTQVQVQEEILQLIPQPFTFRLQQNPQKVFIIIHVPKYKKQQIDFVVSQSKIYLSWKSRKVHKYLLLNISVESKYIQTVYVVDFIVINISKHEDHQINVESVSKDYKQFNEQLLLEKENNQKLVQMKKKQQQQNKIQNNIPQQSIQPVQAVLDKIEEQPLKNQHYSIKQNTLEKEIKPQFINFKINIVDELD